MTISQQSEADALNEQLTDIAMIGHNAQWNGTGFDGVETGGHIRNDRIFGSDPFAPVQVNDTIELDGANLKKNGINYWNDPPQA